MNGVVARRNNFAEPILQFLEDAYKDFAELTGRTYGLISEYKTADADTVFVSLGSAAENIEAAVDYLRETRGASVGSIHVNVIRPFPEAAIVNALRGKKNVIILERTDEALSPDNPLGKDIRTALSKAIKTEGRPSAEGLPSVSLDEVPTIFGGTYGLGSRDFRPEHIIGAYEYATAGRCFVHGAGHRPSLLGGGRRDTVSVAAGRGCGALPFHRWMGRNHYRQEPGRDSRRLERSALRPRRIERRAGQSQGSDSRQRKS
jgi:hypothetical protein